MQSKIFPRVHSARFLESSPKQSSKQDPVLSRAAELAGAKLNPAKAGAMFPREWVKGP